MLHAEKTASAPKKITSIVRVYHWSTAKNVWYEDQVIKTFVELFDNNGRLVQKDLTDGKEGLLERTILSYSGNTIKKTFYNNRNAIIRTAVVDIQDNIHTEIVRRTDGRIMFQYVTFFDQKGNIIKIEQKDANGSLLFKKVYLYDNGGNCIAIQNENPDGSVAVEITYQYEKFDNDGNWLSRKELYSYGDVYNRPHEQVHRTIE